MKPSRDYEELRGEARPQAFWARKPLLLDDGRSRPDQEVGQLRGSRSGEEAEVPEQDESQGDADAVISLEQLAFETGDDELLQSAELDATVDEFRMERQRQSQLVSLIAGENYVKTMRDTFQAADRDCNGEVTGRELAEAWGASAEANLGRRLTVDEAELLAAEVHRVFNVMDVNDDGKVREDEWVHFALLELAPPGPAATQAIVDKLKSQPPETLPALVHQWEKADSNYSGSLTIDEVAGILEMTTAEAEAIVKKMRPMGGNDMSYAEFCAFHLKLELVHVELYFYDISNGVGKYLAPVLLGRRLRGIWHTSIVVHDTEFYLYGKVLRAEPGTTHFGTPVKSISLGYTLRTMEEIDRYRFWDMRDCTQQTYDILRKNCHHASDRMAQYLVGRSVPDEARLLCKKLFNAPLVKLLRPTLNKMLGGDGLAIKDEPVAKPSLKRCRLSDDLGDLMSSKGGNLVTYTPPNEVVRIVARVARLYENGTRLDLVWFDVEGVLQKATGVKATDVEAHHEIRSRDSFQTCLGALTDPHRGDASGTDSSP